MTKGINQEDEGRKTIHPSSSSNAKYSEHTIKKVEKFVSTDENSSEPSTSTSLSAGFDKTRNADKLTTGHTTKTVEPPVKCFSHQIDLVHPISENMNDLDELGDRLKGYDDSRLKLIMERHYTPHTHHSGAQEISSRKNQVWIKISVFLMTLWPSNMSKIFRVDMKKTMRISRLSLSTAII